MALSLFQKIRIVLRGWSRRRESAAEARRQSFVDREASWGVQKDRTTPSETTTETVFDLDGLQVAWLDDSGRISYFLDRDSLEVVECECESTQFDEWRSDDRYVQVPRRTSASDLDDRMAFVETLDGEQRRSLSEAARDAAAFREAIARDRKIERAWYNFKTERSIDAIETWLRSVDPPLYARKKSTMPRDDH